MHKKIGRAFRSFKHKHLGKSIGGTIGVSAGGAMLGCAAPRDETETSRPTANAENIRIGFLRAIGKAH